jgi:hypothetical protein
LSWKTSKSFAKTAISVNRIGIKLIGGPVTESEIKKQIADFLERLPGCIFTVHLAGRRGYQSRHLKLGWPDISGSWNGKPLGIEVKKPGGTLSLEQHAFIERAKSAGWIAFVATSVECVREALGKAAKP